MPERLVISLDQGTTVSQCIVFDHTGHSVDASQRAFRQLYPRPGWVEHDPEEIWESQIGTARETLSRLGDRTASVGALGISNQRETVLVWDCETGKPIANAIVWQCRRTASSCARLRAEGLETMIIEKTGLPLDAYFSASKLKWLLDNIPDAREKARDGRLLFGTVDSWLLWRLTGGRVHATDYTNASRTMLFNIHTLSWDRELLDLFSIPDAMLPEVKPSRSRFGTADGDVLGMELPVTGMAGNQQAALFGQLCASAGCAKATYGGGCFILMHTGDKAIRSRNGLVTTIAASADGSAAYALEGSIFSGGDMVRWLREEMGVVKTTEESDELAASVRDNAGVYIVPAFAGLGAPYWNPRARGTVVGLGHAVGKAHVIRASLESMAYQTMDVIRAMEQDADTTVCVLKADGDGANNNFLMQFQADILDSQVVRPGEVESAALGAAYLAGLGIGLWKDVDEIRMFCEDETLFSPSLGSGMREKLISGWRKAVDTALYWAN